MGVRWLLALAVAVSGCAVAFGNTHGYHDVVANLSYSGARKVAVATRDERPYVLSGAKEPRFVGLSRGGYNNPFDVVTTSRKPLADDMSQSLERSLDEKGFDAVALPVGPGEDEGLILAKVVGTGAERVLVLSLREWKSDTMLATWLRYDVSLRVLDPEGALLAESSLAESRELGGSPYDPPANAERAIPRAFRRALESLLEDPAIAAALR